MNSLALIRQALVTYITETCIISQNRHSNCQMCDQSLCVNS